MVLKVMDDTFETEVIKSDVPAVVDFWAPWCGPCMVIATIAERLSEEYEGKIKFYKLNVDENPKMADKYQVLSIPLLLFFNKGKVVDEFVGAVPENIIRTKLLAILKKWETP